MDVLGNAVQYRYEDQRRLRAAGTAARQTGCNAASRKWFPPRKSYRADRAPGRHARSKSTPAFKWPPRSRKPDGKSSHEVFKMEPK
jgi:hypothetical protein